MKEENKQDPTTLVEQLIEDYQIKYGGGKAANEFIEEWLVPSLLSVDKAAEEREAGFWRLAIVHLNKAERESVLATCKKLKEHMASRTQ